MPTPIMSGQSKKCLMGLACKAIHPLATLYNVFYKSLGYCFGSACLSALCKHRLSVFNLDTILHGRICHLKDKSKSFQIEEGFDLSRPIVDFYNYSICLWARPYENSSLSKSLPERFNSAFHQ